MIFITQVLRAQNLVAAEAEARQSGQIRPGGAYPLAGMASAAGAYPPAGIPPGAMALPQGLRHSLPVNESSLSARQKIQAKIDSERFIVPQREDTKRFHPARQLVKVCQHLCATRIYRNQRTRKLLHSLRYSMVFIGFTKVLHS